MAEPLPVVREAAVTRSRAPVYLPRAFRRAYQGFFLLFFFASLALMTDEGIRRFPVRFPLELDPLSALSILASSWLLPSGLAVALVIVALTLVFGRAFCGWICPLGTLHQPPPGCRRGSGAARTTGQPLASHFRLKYLLLVALLVAALAGTLLHRPPRPGLARHPLVRLRPCPRSRRWPRPRASGRAPSAAPG